MTQKVTLVGIALLSFDGADPPPSTSIWFPSLRLGLLVLPAAPLVLGSSPDRQNLTYLNP